MRFQSRKSFAAALAICLSVVAAPGAQAQFSYTYTSGKYNALQASNPAFTYTTDQRITFTLFMSSAMAANSSVDLLYTTQSWVANDGKYTWGGTDVVGFAGEDVYNPGQVMYLFDAFFRTDATGTPYEWNFSLFNGARAGSLYSRSSGAAGQVNTTFVSDYVYSRPTNFGEGDIEKAGVTEPGVWTMSAPVTATPEPASMLLVATGLAGLGLDARRRRSQRAG